MPESRRLNSDEAQLVYLQDMLENIYIGRSGLRLEEVVRFDN
jgi:hypothetical protein